MTGSRELSLNPGIFWNCNLIHLNAFMCALNKSKSLLGIYIVYLNKKVTFCIFEKLLVGNLNLALKILVLEA